MEDLNEELSFSDARTVLREICRLSQIFDQPGITDHDRQRVEQWISDPQTVGQAQAAWNKIADAQSQAGAQPQSNIFGHGFRLTKLLITVIAGGVAIAAAATGLIFVAVPAAIMGVIAAFSDVVKRLTRDEMYVLRAVQDVLKTKAPGSNVTREEIVQYYERKGEYVPVELDGLLLQLVEKNALSREGGLYTHWTYKEET